MSETTGAPGGSGVLPPPRFDPLLLPPPFPEPVEPIVPWISIWTRPRATLRRILEDDPRRSVYRLAALGGIAGALNLATTSGLGDTLPVAATIALVLSGGALGGILSLFVFASLVRVAGRWFGGRGGTPEIMAALAWANVPTIAGLLLWLPRAVFLGEEMFRSVPSGLEGNPPASLFFACLELAQAVVDFWGLVITLKCVSEAHRFSAWRTLVTLILVGVMVIVPLGLLVIAAQALS